MEIVRVSTAGSVDDGKSTLIGRLLFDNQALTHEQESLVRKKTAEKGLTDLDFSVITDGLVAEREQGITIDVAHIYFSTQSHKFILADSPGHIEYTRNMVTGASTSDVSIILIDARKGLLEQSYRHFFIAQLLRMKRIVFCVNKMDLVDYNEDVFLKIAVEIQMMVQKAGLVSEYFIVPVSSLKGDNIVYASEYMRWYSGPTLNTLLHQPLKENNARGKFRFDVQQVFHVQNQDFVDFRGFAGRIVGGSISKGDRVTVLPSGKESTVKEIRRHIELLESALPGESVVISLEDDIDCSRGSILCKTGEEPTLEKHLSATIVWMDERPAVIGQKYFLRAGAREIAVKLESINNSADLITGEQRKHSAQIGLNEIVSTTWRLSQPAMLDAFTENRGNGVFILVDPQSNHTVATGFVD